MLKIGDGTLKNNRPIHSLRLAAIRVFVLATLIAGSVQAAGYEELPPAGIVPELAALGLTGLTVERHRHPRLQGHFDPEDRYFLVVRLGTLTRAQFDSIRELYGNHSPIAYFPDREYRLRDFLPAVLQAVLNKTFTPVSYDLSFLQSPGYERLISQLRRSSSREEEKRLVEGLLSNGLTTETNCWNATVETLNALQGGASTYRVFTPARWDIDRELKRAGEAVEETRLQPWDVLLISQQSLYTGREILQHTALVINQQLVFEKVDSAADYPYRLALREDVLNKYRRALANTFRLEYRRYGRGQLFTGHAGRHDDAFPKLVAKIIRKVRPEVQPGNISYGCDSGAEDRCSYNFQVIEKLDLVASETGGKLQGPAAILDRFRSLEDRQGR